MKKYIASEALTYETIRLGEFIDTIVAGTVDSLIYEEFASRLRDKEQTYAVRLHQQISILEYKYNQVHLIVRYFEAEGIVKKQAPNVDLPDPAVIWKALQNIIPARRTDSLQVIANRATRLLTEQREKERELAQIQKISTGGVVDRSYFTRMIAVVSSHHKMQINRREMLLSEFVELLLIMREAQESMEQEVRKHKK